MCSCARSESSPQFDCGNSFCFYFVFVSVFFYAFCFYWRHSIVCVCSTLYAIGKWAEWWQPQTDHGVFLIHLKKISRNWQERVIKLNFYRLVSCSCRFTWATNKPVFLFVNCHFGIRSDSIVRSLVKPARAHIHTHTYTRQDFLCARRCVSFEFLVLLTMSHCKLCILMNNSHEMRY